MADELEKTDPQSGQESIKPLTTKNAVTENGTLVRPKEDTKIYSTGKNKFLGAKGIEHTVHRIQAEKFVSRGHATTEAPEAKEV